MDKLKPTSDTVNVDLLTSYLEKAYLKKGFFSYCRWTQGEPVFISEITEHKLQKGYLYHPRYKELIRRVVNILSEGEFSYPEYVKSHLVGIHTNNLTMLDYEDYNYVFHKEWFIGEIQRRLEYRYFRYGIPYFYKRIRYKGPGLVFAFITKSEYNRSIIVSPIIAVSTPQQWERSKKNMIAFGNTEPTYMPALEGVYLGALDICERYRFMPPEQDSVVALRSPWKEPLKIDTIIQVAPEVFKNSFISFKLGEDLRQDYNKKKVLRALL